MKKLSVVIAGSGQIHDIEIPPGTIAGDVLNQLNLPDYLLSNGANEQRGAHFFRFYINHPPEELSRHNHWACFIHRGGHSYEVYLSRQPPDVGSGIMSIERLITEAFEQVGRKAR